MDKRYLVLWVTLVAILYLAATRVQSTPAVTPAEPAELPAKGQHFEVPPAPVEVRNDSPAAVFADFRRVAE